MIMTSHRTASIIGLIAFVLIFAAPGAARADKPAAFIKIAGTQMVAAARSGSQPMMTAVIRRYSDLPDISLFSLGSYRNRLPGSRRGSYYDGVSRFMARYFIGQAKQYQVAKFQVYTQSRKASWGYEVDSVVTLTSGTTYTLRWHVVPRKGGYRVRDVSILGVWITPISMIGQQKNLFVDYIQGNGGKITALLSALGG